MLLLIGMALILFIFLAIMTLMINPPEKWVRKLTGDDDKKKRRS